MPAQLVPSHHQQIPERAGAGQRADLGPFHVVPSHGDLNHLESVDVRNEQIFHVEAESIQALARKDHASSIVAEQLESTLGVEPPSDLAPPVPPP